MNTLFGIKSDMTARYSLAGKRLTVTSVHIEPNIVVEKKTAEKAGYSAVALGIGSKKATNKALTKKLSGAGKVPKFINEAKTDKDIAAGSLIAINEVFAVGDVVSVTGTSKGRGFTGVVKRYNFKGGPKTHGQSDRHRARGSLGSGTTPGRVFRGLRMAGRSGGATITVRNLVVLHINEGKNEILLSGPVPGHVNSLLRIVKTGEKKGFEGIELMESDKSAAVEAVETPVVAEAVQVEEAVVEPTVEVAAVEVAEVKEEK